MSMELAERLKAKLTDRFVVVDASVPELRRFANWTGKVKTVNMSGRALVEFDGPADIGWYDIDPAFLTVVDGPRPKAAKAEPKAAAKPAAAAAPAAAKPAPAATAGGQSPLDKIRAQQAAKAGGAPTATTPAAAAPAAGGAKLSPMEMIRAQQAAKQAGGSAPPPPAAAAPPPPAVAPPPAAAPQAAAKPAALPTTGPDGKPLSKLELIRQQGAAKR